MSKIEVNTITQQCGPTLTVGGGACKSVTVDATTVTIGKSGGTVTLACGATQSGFGQTYSATEYCTTVKAAPFTAVAGKGYFVNTTCGAVTVTLPATPTVGDVISVSDYAGTFQTNNLTICSNSNKINGGVGFTILNTQGETQNLIYIDSTKGWKNIQNSSSTDVGATFYDVQYLVVAGGGGGGTNHGGGGGGGGFRSIACKSFQVIKGQSYPITIGGGGGGAGAAGSPSGPPNNGTQGGNSIFSTITSTGGGYGGGGSPPAPAAGPGGSGGGGGTAPSPGTYSGAGTGNTPPVSPPQGNPGSPCSSVGYGGGGGGAGAVGGPNTAGGIGSPFTDLGPAAPSYGEAGPNPGRYFSGGGGGYSVGSGGIGGGGDYPGPQCGKTGATNSGGGGAGCGSGGSGIIAIRYVTACASPTVAGGNSINTCGSDTIRIFTGDGTFTA
jgi:hypothetical protein